MSQLAHPLPPRGLGYIMYLDVKMRLAAAAAAVDGHGIDLFEELVLDARVAAAIG